MFKKRLVMGGCSLLLAVSPARAVDNPVSVVLDRAIMRYNGGYFAMGTQTNGQMLVSGNLADWDVAGGALLPDVPGPCELLYRNGLFFLYAEGSGYAVASSPTGPFSEIKKGSFPGRDLRLFQDESGALFSVDRRIGSKKAGEIWLRPYETPWQTTGRPRQLLDGRPGMWDSFDSADLGAPEIVDYRGNYYLLYAANHPGPRTGLRGIGVAMNENPGRFENTDKLADPVLARNVERLARTYRPLLPSGEYTEWEGSYTLDRPVEGWMQPGFNMEGWQTGKGGFGFPSEEEGSQITACRTPWSSGNIWVRREFDLAGGAPKTPVLNIRHEGAVQVFLNGRKVFESSKPTAAYSNFDIAQAAAGAFRPAGNVLAVHAVAPAGAAFRFLDFGLSDAGEQAVEPTVYGLDAPRIVTGPNGFEKWMAYRAYWNGEAGTGIDRVFFCDDRMVVDGPTTAHTPGYHPPPALPTFSDRFQREDTPAWMFKGGDWKRSDGVLHQSVSTEPATAYLQQKPAINYLFETNIRLPANGRGTVGVVAYGDGTQELLITIDPAGFWEYRERPGRLTGQRSRLPEAFHWLETPPGYNGGGAPSHLLRVEKNGGRFEVMLDHFKLTSGKPIMTRFTGAGVPGLHCRNSAAEFSGTIYTVGWDEHGEYITGWGAAADGTPPGGEWRQGKEHGLEQRKHSEPGRAFKGDLLDQYEFTVNVRTGEFEEGKERLYGVFPVFADQKNFLKAVIDTRSRELVVSGRRNGKAIGPFKKSLARRIPCQPLYDEGNSDHDIKSWIFSLPSQSVVDSLDIRWLEGKYAYLQREFFVPTEDMVVRYAQLVDGRKPPLWDGGHFRDADEPRPETQQAGMLNPVAIRPEVANYIGYEHVSTAFSVPVLSLVGEFLRWLMPGEEVDSASEMLGAAVGNTAVSDDESRPQEVLVGVAVESSYFFRCVKLKDRVVVELNGQPMLEVEGEWPPSQVGLLTEGQPCSFNGITLMHLPSSP